jgi:putative ABC transport system substrate-binding protein
MEQKLGGIKMKKYLSMLFVFILALVAMTGCSTSNTEKTSVDEKETMVKRIGVTQIVEHPSLDLIRNGVYEGLKDNGFEDGINLEIEFLNAQGSMENTMTIANEFESEAFDVVVGITTPSTQALFNKITNTPIVYAAVTDPAASGLVGDNITGICDMTPVKKQLLFLKELLPEAKKVGMIYNSGEINSEILVDIAKDVSEELGLEIIVASITNSNEVSTALDFILDKVDVLYAQKDNTLASAFPVIVKKADEKNIPIIGATKDFVDAGALASDGPSEFEIGYQAGIMVARILNGEDVKNIEPGLVSDTERDFNEEVAKKYGITITK